MIVSDVSGPHPANPGFHSLHDTVNRSFPALTTASYCENKAHQVPTGNRSPPPIVHYSLQIPG